MSFPKKWEKKLPDGFKDIADSLKTEEIRDRIMKCESVIMDTEREMAEDEKLAALKEAVKDLSGGYRDVLLTEMAKIKYCMYTLASRGQA